MKEILINNITSGKKVFRFLKSTIPQMKNSELFHVIRKGLMKVNNKKTEPDYILKQGDIVKLFLPDTLLKNNSSDKFRSVKTDFEIIYEDDKVIVINKKKGDLVHPDKNNYKNTLSESVKAYLYKKNEYSTDSLFTPSPCHRLDTNTSGVIVFAKTQTALKDITSSFRERECDKTYVAIVAGRISMPILITSDIDATENKENKVIVSKVKVYESIPDKVAFLQKNAVSATLVRPIESNNIYSIIEVDLWTGKKHQIRAHLQAIDHAILGDQKYFTNDSRRASDKYGINSYFLHCKSLKIPEYGEFVANIDIERFRPRISNKV